MINWACVGILILNSFLAEERLSKGLKEKVMHILIERSLTPAPGRVFKKQIEKLKAKNARLSLANDKAYKLVDELLVIKKKASKEIRKNERTINKLFYFLLFFMISTVIFAMIVFYQNS